MGRTPTGNLSRQNLTLSSNQGPQYLQEVSDIMNSTTHSIATAPQQKGASKRSSISVLFESLKGLLVKADARPAGPSRMKIETRTNTDTECLIIGAGHCGLSVAASLKKYGIEPIVLEQHGHVGDQWRERYERLHLHHITDAMHLSDDMEFPSHYPRYLSRLDFADYLESFSQLQNIDIRCKHKVIRLGKNSTGKWEIEVRTDTGDKTLLFTAEHVVLAAGTTGITPRYPDLPGKEQWLGQVLHSHDYNTPDEFTGKRVLVVGAGNSGIEILCDLYDHGAITSMLIRAPNSWVTREAYAIYHRALLIARKIFTYVPFTWLVAPFFILGLDAYLKFDINRRYGDLKSKGIKPLPATPMIEAVKSLGKRPPTYVDGTWGDVGVSIFELIRDGEVQTYTAEISHLIPDTNTVVFKDQSQADFDAILLCTGFEPVVEYYKTFVDKDIYEKLSRDDVFRFLAPMKELPGLWIAMGSILSSRFGQAALGERIAAQIQNRSTESVILNPVLSFLFAGLEPMMIRVPRITIIINVVALILVLGFALT